MKTVGRTPMWAIILILLLLAHLSWIFWNLYGHTTLRVAIKQFKFEEVHTNDMSGIGLFTAKTGQPIWTRFNENGEPFIENYFFRGKDVFDVTLKSNRPPVFNVYFRGLSNSVTRWLNAGGGDTFTERIFYDTNGRFLSNEVWYNQAWHTVDRRNNKNGIIINEQWHQLAFDTNGMWTIEAPTNMP